MLQGVRQLSYEKKPPQWPRLYCQPSLSTTANNNGPQTLRFPTLGYSCLIFQSIRAATSNKVHRAKIGATITDFPFRETVEFQRRTRPLGFEKECRDLERTRFSGMFRLPSADSCLDFDANEIRLPSFSHRWPSSGFSYKSWSLERESSKEFKKGTGFSLRMLACSASQLLR